MMYKDTFKSILSNFHLVWKILAYQIISILCVVGLAYACSLPIVNVLQSEGVTAQFTDLFTNFSRNFNIYELLANSVKLVDNFCYVIAQNISELWLYIVLFLFITILLNSFISGLYKFASTNVLYYYFSSNIKIGYTTSLINTLKTNIKFQLASLVVLLPINVLLLTILYFAVRWLVLSEGLLIIAPVIIIALAIFLYAFKITLFSGWLPAIAVFNCGVWAGLKKGVKAVFRRFYRSFSTVILIIFTLFILNVICLICTFGVSLVVTLPLTMLAFITFGMVMFYCSQGMRFYVDSNTVITPKRLEQTDGKKGLKFII